MLSEQLTAANISLKHADNDADVLIFETAITLFPPAPEKLLSTHFCNCKGGSNNYGYRTVGLLCLLICTDCQRQSCFNVVST